MVVPKQREIVRPNPAPTRKPADMPRVRVAVEPVKVAGVYLPGNPKKAPAPAAEPAKAKPGKKAEAKKTSKKSAKKTTSKTSKKKKESSPLSLPVFLALCYLGYAFVTEEEK